MQDSPVPTYKLFGEKEWWASPELFHIETIAARSSLYDWEISPHSHDNLLQILLLQQGQAGMTLEARSFELETPCIVLVAPRQIHGFRFLPDVVGHILTMPHYLVAELLALSPELGGDFKTSRHHGLAGDGAALAWLGSCLRGIEEEFTGTAPGRVSMLMAGLTELLVWLARARGTAAGEGEGDRFRRRVDRYHELVDRHFREWLPIDFYARKIGVSTAQLNNICRRVVGCSAQRMIHDRLVLEARRLLAYSDLDVSGVCYALGFRDPAYFSRFFIRKVGMPPSVFRQMHQRKSAG